MARCDALKSRRVFPRPCRRIDESPPGENRRCERQSDLPPQLEPRLSQSETAALPVRVWVYDYYLSQALTRPMSSSRKDQSSEAHRSYIQPCALPSCATP